MTNAGLGIESLGLVSDTGANEIAGLLNIDDKVSADQRGHGLGVSLGVYAISDLEQKIEAVKRLESDVIVESDLLQ